MTRTKLFLMIGALFLIGMSFVYFVFIPGYGRLARKQPKHISVLVASDLQLSALDGLKAGLKDLGYKENEDIIIDLKNPKGDRDLTKTMARIIIAAKPDLIIGISSTATSNLKDADSKAMLPIVFIDVGNFKILGIDNIQHPGGYMTGVVTDNIQQAPKRMQILKTLLPNLKKIGVILNPKGVSYQDILDAYKDGASKLGINLIWYHVSTKEELIAVMEKISKDKPEAIMTTNEATISGNPDLITPILKQAKIPSIDFNIEIGVSSGYLMVYGPSRYDAGKQGSFIVNKIINGANPGDVPIEFAHTPTFEINAALAKEMGVSIPQELLDLANKIYNK